MGALIIIAVIAAFFALILLIPIKTRVYFRLHNDDREFDLELKYGPVRIAPGKKKEKAPKKAEDKKKDKKDKPEPDKKKKVSTGDIVSFAWDKRDKIKRMIAAILGYILGHMVKIKKIKIRLVLGLDDAMQTALIYGAANAVIFNTIGLMDKHMRLGKHNVDLKPAFNEPHIYTEDEAEISTCIFNILALAAVALRHAVPLLISFLRLTKSGRVPDGAEMKEDNENGKSD